MKLVDKGYIYKDAATYAESSPDLIKTNVTGCYFVDSRLAWKPSQSLATGYDMTCVKGYRRSELISIL